MERLLVFENKGNLNDSSDTGRHQGLAKHAVRHGADGKLLRVGRHCPASHKDNKPGDEVSLGVAVTVPAEPHTSQSGAPPNYSHGSVLPVVSDPSTAPAMLSEGVDATPSSNDSAVKELLRSSAPLQPNLTNKQNDSQHDSVANESAAHDEMCQALSEVVALAEAQGRDATEYDLRPRNDWHGLADDGVAGSDQLSDSAVKALLPVTLEIKA